MNYSGFFPETMCESIDKWLSSLPDGVTLKVFHTEERGFRLTWLKCEENNVLYLVGEKH